MITLGTLLCPPAPEKNRVLGGSLVPRFCWGKWTSVGEKNQQCGVGAGRSPLCSRAVSRQKGPVGHGFGVSRWKAAFEPHVGLQSIPVSLGASRVQHLFFPCRPRPEKPALLCSSQRGALVLRSSVGLSGPRLSTSLDQDPGVRGRASRAPQPTCPAHRLQHSSGITVSTLLTHHLHSSCLPSSEVSPVTLLTGEETGAQRRNSG